MKYPIATLHAWLLGALAMLYTIHVVVRVIIDQPLGDVGFRAFVAWTLFVLMLGVIDLMHTVHRSHP